MTKEKALELINHKLDLARDDALIMSDTEYEVLQICAKALEQEPKIGHWILTSDDDYEYCTCSECGYQNGKNWMIGSQIKYCQECGAKMTEKRYTMLEYQKYLTQPPIPYGGYKPKTISDEKLKELIEKETEYRIGIYQRLMNREELEDEDCLNNCIKGRK